MIRRSKLVTFALCLVVTPMLLTGCAKPTAATTPTTGVHPFGWTEKVGRIRQIILYSGILSPVAQS